MPTEEELKQLWVRTGETSRRREFRVTIQFSPRQRGDLEKLLNTLHAVLKDNYLAIHIESEPEPMEHEWEEWVLEVTSMIPEGRKLGRIVFGDTDELIASSFSATVVNRTKSPPRLQFHFDSLDRYHGAAALVMTAGSLGMIAASCLTGSPLWAGFLAGALPTFAFTALVHPQHA